MEFFINELSFHDQLHDDIAIQESVKKLIQLIDSIRENVKDGNFLKSQTLIYSNLKQSIAFTSTINHLPKDLNKLAKKVVFDTALIKDWEPNRTHISTICYECDVINGAVTNTSVAEAAERKIIDQINRFLINIDPSNFSCVTETVVTKQSQPSIKVELKCICKGSDLKLHFGLLHVYPDEHLRDAAKFTPTSYNVQGRKIYIEKATNNYWYLDNFHKSHFEIFNHSKIHLGIADLQGNRIEKSADPNKNNKLPV